jgi:hypothetical protein
MNTTAIKLVIKVWHDDMPDDPTEGDEWKMYSFSRRHSNYADPDTLGFDEDGHPEKELQAKIDKGLAFPLSYFEHGNCVWSLQDTGPQCRFDSVSLAGLLVWEGDDDVHADENVEDRTTFAKAFIEQFTNWCNGEVYGYTVEAFKVCECCKQDVELSEEEANLDLPSCGGYYADDIDGMVIDMKTNIGDDWADYEVSFEEQHAYGVADEVKRLWKVK